MKVFVTGAAGFVGRALIDELVTHGHQVTGLARSDAAADVIESRGGHVHRGSIQDLDSLRVAAQSADGVIHLAFDFIADEYPRVCAEDRAAIQAMAEAMQGTGKPLVIAAGTLLLPGDGLATEDSKQERVGAFTERAKSEHLIMTLSRGLNIRGSSVRLAALVHGPGDKLFTNMFGELAKKNGFVTYIDQGTSHWPAVHRLDAARLFRLALENGRAACVYHGVAEQGVSTKALMETIGKRLDLPAKSLSLNEATEAIGFFSEVLAWDNPVSSNKTQLELGWVPTQVGVLEDIETTYFMG